MNTRPRIETGLSKNPTESLHRLRILVADDNQDTVLTLTRLLRQEGHHIHGAYNGPDAIRLAHLYRFDVVILDVEMPGSKGYAIAQELRAYYYPSRGPLLIAISGKWNRPSEKLLAWISTPHY